MKLRGCGVEAEEGKNKGVVCDLSRASLHTLRAKDDFGSHRPATLQYYSFTTLKPYTVKPHLPPHRVGLTAFDAA